MKIVSRKSWGARFGTGELDHGPESRVVIHHSHRPALTPDASPAAEAGAVLSIERFHVESKGWEGIGYNFLVAPSGRVYEGRGWRYRGAHAGPVNGFSIGVCLLIDGQVTEPSAAIIRAVRDLISEGIRLKEIDPAYVVSGHRDHMPRTCPGNRVYARLQEFRHDAGPNTKVPIGSRVWSDHYGEHLIVTRYVSDQDWHFLPESQVGALKAPRGATPFSKMPAARF